MVLGTLSVLRSNALSTGQNVVRGLIGTVVGFIAGAGLLAVIGTDHALLWFLLPPAILFAGFRAGGHLVRGRAGRLHADPRDPLQHPPAGRLAGRADPDRGRRDRLRGERRRRALLLAAGRRGRARPRAGRGVLGQRALPRCGGRVRGRALRPRPAPAARTGRRIAARRGGGAAARRRLSRLSGRARRETRRSDRRDEPADRGGRPAPGRRRDSRSLAARRRPCRAVTAPRRGLRCSPAPMRLPAGTSGSRRASTREAGCPSRSRRIRSASGRLVDAVRRDLRGEDGAASAVAVRIIWTGDHLDAARRLQDALVGPARAVSERALGPFDGVLPRRREPVPA